MSQPQPTAVSESDTQLLLNATRLNAHNLATAAGCEAGLRIEDMMDDLIRVSISVAQTYTDQSCFALHFDELKAECLKKVVDVISANWLNRARTRGEFFAVAKTAMMNHVRGIVQRHRFTIKRTGHKAPDRNDPMSMNVKPDVSLDDPDVHLQVSNQEDGSATMMDEELVADLRVLLTPVEGLVLDQLLEPNSSAYLHAFLHSVRGRRKTDSVRVKMTHQQMADGLGLPMETFTVAHNSIKRKYLKLMSGSGDDTRYNAALATLEDLFGVQVPPSTEAIVVARLFTIASRDQIEKVTDSVRELLDIVGAKPPKIEDSNRLSCFAVLFQRNHRTCTSCGLRSACQTEALNYGLGEITLSPKLLGSRASTRIPVLTDNNPDTDMDDNQPETTTGSDNSGPFTPTERDEALLSYLQENFKTMKFGTDVYYTHKTGKSKCVFFIGKEGEPFDLRFCKPSDDLKKSLVRKVRSFYLPTDMSTEDATRLIDQHANETFSE